MSTTHPSEPDSNAKPDSRGEPGGNCRTGETRMSLIGRARARQGDAWCELVDLYGPLVAHWSRRCGLDSHSTADVVQEIFTAVYKSLNRFEPRATSGSFRAWLWTITVNKLRDRNRARRPREQARGGSSALLGLHSVVDPYAADFSRNDLDIPDTEPTSTEDLQCLMARAMEQVRAEFEEKTWAIFIRSAVDLIDTQTVAQQFSVSPATVRKIRSRIMRRLRQQMGDLA